MFFETVLSCDQPVFAESALYRRSKKASSQILFCRNAEKRHDIYGHTVLRPNRRANYFLLLLGLPL